MEKTLEVYPIHTGDELNVFAAQNIKSIRIMDMAGNIVYNEAQQKGNKDVINIKTLANATYIVEVAFENDKTGRAVFVKM